MRKKLLSMFLMCVMVFSMSAVSVFAAQAETVAEPSATAIEIAPMASGSGSTGTMNSIYGAESKAWPVTISASTAKVTSVTLNVTVSSGSDRMNVYVQAPDGTIATRTIGASSTLNFSEFNTKNANGTWYVSIQTLGTVSTATARLTVNY